MLEYEFYDFLQVKMGGLPCWDCAFVGFQQVKKRGNHCSTRKNEMTERNIPMRVYVSEYFLFKNVKEPCQKQKCLLY